MNRLREPHAVRLVRDAIGDIDTRSFAHNAPLDAAVAFKATVDDRFMRKLGAVPVRQNGESITDKKWLAMHHMNRGFIATVSIVEACLKQPVQPKEIGKVLLRSKAGLLHIADPVNDESIDQLSKVLRSTEAGLSPVTTHNGMFAWTPEALDTLTEPSSDSFDLPDRATLQREQSARVINGLVWDKVVAASFGVEPAVH